MPRRTATLLASTLTLITLLCVAILMPVPYSKMSPGPTVNTLGEHDGSPVLRISGHKVHPVTGNLNMTTVRVTGADYPMNLVEAVSGWLEHDVKIVEHDTLYPQGQTAEQADQENAEEFTRSQDSAKVVALEQLDIPVSSRVIVDVVVKGGAAEGKLHAGDVIRSVDGTPVKEPGDVAKLVTGHRPGEKVTFTVVPEAEAGAGAGEKNPGTEEIVITTIESTEGEERAIVGIGAGVEHIFPFEIDIELADVGGPSAGLMFALGIIEKLTAEDLTGGRFVAGTGTIDDEGVVGPIGGIELKTIAAREAGAEYFLTPEDNCASAASDTPDGLTLVKITTIDDAMTSLGDIGEGNTAGLPRCAAS